MSANYQSPRQRITRLLMVILIVLLVVYVYIRISTSITERQISNNRNTVQEKTRELDSLFSLTGFTRLEDVQIIREGLDTMPRSTHISTLIDMINTIEQIDSADGDSIVLSDFRVTLDDLSVKGRVTNLLLLYYSAPNRSYISLIDKFSQLDFIENMRIQNYTRLEEGIYEFVLQANINHDNTTK